MGRVFSRHKTQFLIAERDLSIRGLAHTMDGDGEQNRRQLHKWLRGDHSPSTRNVKRIAVGLGVEADELYEDDDADLVADVDAFAAEIEAA